MLPWKSDLKSRMNSKYGINVGFLQETIYAIFVVSHSKSKFTIVYNSFKRLWWTYFSEPEGIYFFKRINNVLK